MNLKTAVGRSEVFGCLRFFAFGLHQLGTRRGGYATSMQRDSGGSSGPHPVRRHSPSKDGRPSTPYGATFPSRAGEEVPAAI
jgi:hypothetical protein